MLDNHLAAQMLFSHHLATQEQILAVWPGITPEKDVGMLLVERGVLPKQTYLELVSYLQTQVPAPGPTAYPQEGPRSAAGPAPVSDIPAPYSASPGFASASDGDPESEGMPPEDPESGFVDLDLNAENWTPAPDEEPRARRLTREEYVRQRRDAEPAPLPDPAARPAPSPEASAPSAPAPVPEQAPARGQGPADGPRVEAPGMIGAQSSWEELLAFARVHDAADLHLSAGQPILLRRYGILQAATPGPMDQASLRGWAEQALGAEDFRAFEAKGDLEFIYTLPHHGRYRVTLLKQRRGWDLTARVIPGRIRTMEEAGLPEACRELTRWAQGLVLVTGPVGCGKTSTLATLVDIVNRERRDHIITIEEPIEILYPPAGCRITQRQIGPHTRSHDAALRAALREDPDIIVISELRDLDTIRLAVSAAETGHLVFGTMNTANAARTLGRLIDSFPPEEQGIVRSMISESLRGVISQQLLPRKDGQGMLPAFEVLMVNPAVANMIRKDEIHQLGTAMLTGKTSGMVLLDDSLRFLVERGLVDPREAMARAANPKDFERYLGRR